MKQRIIFLSVAVWAIITALAQKAEPIILQGSHGAIYAEVQRPVVDGKTPLVVICHGFSGNCHAGLLTAIADSLQSAGVASIRFDFNGHGLSEGRFQDMTVPNEIEDLKRVLVWAEAQPWVDGVSLLGHSQGGVVVSMAAGELGADNIKRIVLMAPAAVLRDDALRGNTMGAMYDPWHMTDDYVQLSFSGLKLGRKFIETAVTLSIYETALQYTGQALVIHGTYDRVVPYTYGERYHQGYADSRLHLIEGEDHGFSQHTNEAVDAAVAFLCGD